jgi:nucleoside-diphosphate-sugar epimerase
MNILVTGGAGYIGSLLVPELINLNYNVTVLDNFMFKQNSLINIDKKKNFELIIGDVRDNFLIKDIVKKFDVIIPLAALVGAPLCDLKPTDAVLINEKSIEFMSKELSNLQRVIMPVSNSGYGIGNPNEVCTEETPLNPISLYGRSKVAAEKIIMQRENSISFRLATVFGMSPRMRLDLLVNYFVYEALRAKKLTIFEGHFKRNYVHIRDVVNVFLFAIQNFERLKSNTFNFGLENANLSKLELAMKIKNYIKDFIFLESKDGKDPDKRNYIVSNKKILSSGYNFKFDLDLGIQELIKGLPNLSEGIHSNV